MSTSGRPRPVRMARRTRSRGTSRFAGPLAIAGLIAAAVIGGIAILPGGTSSPDAAEHSPAATRPAVAAGPSASVPPGRGPTTTAAPSASPPASPHTEPSPTVAPEPAETVTARRSHAPRSAAEFDLENQAIDIGFPLEPSTRYRYRDNWLDRRAGAADPYNHAFESEDGRLLRLHDGIDIYGPLGAPVLAPFDGRVIDPAQRWTPWETDRYGLTVVIESTEPQSEGYTAVLVHLQEVWVAVGEPVSRGDVIGVLGRTGNAEQTRAHLHFELRAPFEIDWSPIGENRHVDAFNPYPSLRRADPQR